MAAAPTSLNLDQKAHAAREALDRWVREVEPHEGNLFEHLYVRRALQRASA